MRSSEDCPRNTRNTRKIPRFSFRMFRVFRGPKKKDGIPRLRDPSFLKGNREASPPGARVEFDSGFLRGGFRSADLFHQRVLGLFDQRVECDLIANGQIAQDFAIELNIRRLEPFDEATVADASVAAGGIEADDPQTAEIALLLSPGR